MKRIISLFLVILLVFAFAACGKKSGSSEENSTETVAETNDGAAESVNDAENETTAAVADAENETTEAVTNAEDDEVELLFMDVVKFRFDKVDPDPKNWTTEEIVACYKSGMAAEDHADVQTDQSFELVGGLEGKAKILESGIKLAMKLGSKPYGALCGGYWALEASDLKSADAHMDGDYVVINLYPKDQVDGPRGDEHEGTVGHVVNVVQGIDEFIGYVEKNFRVLNAKYNDDSVVLKYSNAYAKNVRINTKTGKMESGTWGYTLDVNLDDCSLAGVKFENFHTTINWKCWYPVAD